jgi:molybdenum ABC transporter molybdate-binding protein
MKMIKIIFLAFLVASCANYIGPSSIQAASETAKDDPVTVRVAVAANFARPLQDLIGYFTEEHDGYTFDVTVGATGDFLIEITTAGAGNSPYDLFIAANTAAPTQLKTDGYAPEGDDVENYANGSLVMYANEESELVIGPDTGTATKLLADHDFTGKLVVAEPSKAPYGGASKEVLATVNTNYQYIDEDGEMNTTNVKVEPDIGAAFEKIENGGTNFPLGFIAHSEVCQGDVPETREWIVPSNLYAPLSQAAIVLTTQYGAASRAGAEAFLTYITTDETALGVITSYCYSLPVSAR